MLVSGILAFPHYLASALKTLQFTHVLTPICGMKRRLTTINAKIKIANSVVIHGRRFSQNPSNVYTKGGEALSLFEILTLIIALISAIGGIWAAYIAWKTYSDKRK